MNDYAEALLRPVVERDREFRKESLQEDTQNDDILSFALEEDDSEALELQLPEILTANGHVARILEAESYEL